MTTINQPQYGDGAPNNKGNDGYGYEEHEQFVTNNVNKVSGVPIRSNTTVQPSHGDVLPNDLGMNGYGYEEHEQYVSKQDTLSRDNIKVDSGTIDDIDEPIEVTRIQVLPGSRINAVRDMANTWRMNELGTAVFDSGEYMSSEEVEANTAIYYEHIGTTKTAAFITAVQRDLPGVEIGLVSDLGPDSGMSNYDLERFGIDFDGLDEPNAEL